MPNKKLIQKKLEEIAKQLKHLEIILKLSHAQLFGNESNLYYAERVMERLIAAAIDINMHLAGDLQGKLPEDYFESFINLARLKILPKSFAEKIAPSTSLRNILVHEYQNIDLKKFELALKMAYKQFSQYAKYINDFIKQN